MEIGNKLRKLRLANRLSQEEIAEYLSVKQSTVHNWESGKSLPSLNHLPVIASIYSMTRGELCEMLFGEEISAGGG